MGPQTQSHFTFDEHRDLSRELLKTQWRVLELGKLAAEVYGPESPASIAFTQAVEALGRLRYELQRQAAEDCPGTRGYDLYR